MEVNVKEQNFGSGKANNESILKNVGSTREILPGLLRNREESIFLGTGGEHARNQARFSGGKYENVIESDSGN